MFQLLADIVLVAHFAFIAFALGGGLLLMRWPRLVFLHIPAMSWVVFIEAMGWLCPLTPLENYFLAMAGRDMYQGDFIQHYLLQLVYPAGLTPMIQLLLAGVVVVVNVIIYAVVIIKRRRV